MRKRSITGRIPSYLPGLLLLCLISCNKNIAVIESPGTTVTTTAEQTIIPDQVPTYPHRIGPNDVALFGQYGYGTWYYGSGVPHQKRVDLMPSNYSGNSVTNAALLANFFAISDIHITDKESPAQAIYYGYKWGIISGYSPAMLYSTHMLDAAVHTINRLHKTKPFDFGLSLGDALNSAQYNELKWFVDVMDGKVINPDSGEKDDPNPGPNNDYQDEFKAEGIDPSLKWYQTLGNHDHFWMGMFPPDQYVKDKMIGNTVMNLGNIFTDPSGISSRGYYMGVINGKTPNGEIVGAGPVGNFTTPPVVAPDLNRRFITRNDFMDAFVKSTSSPAGHGFTAATAASGFASYAFEPRSDLPLKVIVLDNTNRDDRTITDGYGKGSLDKERYDWLINELDKGQAEGKLMIIAAHIPIKVVLQQTLIGESMKWSASSYKSEDGMLVKLHTYPNLILWVSGHRHLSVVTPQKSPDPSRPELGFWEVETPSLREFPQQFRGFRITRNSDETISIFATDVDPIAKEGSLVAKARSYAVAANQLFNIEQDPMPSGVANAELVLQLSSEMRAKLANLGTPIK
ncbi:MAG: TIGR03768 family metallophosphoesterase [Sediminibacterium sp.]|nr:TIGR03768 family metallophosphoesterase [Sediminibacterium sp.]